jgi:NhaA family Na+:H+ antiporter
MRLTGEESAMPGAPLRRVWLPFQKFFQTESAGGILLVVTAVVAIIWANVWPEIYTGVWEIPWTIGAPRFELTLTLRDWINDGLMTIFFFLVGLEIKREILVGELASMRRAALPLAAAAGGMAVPAAIYTIFNAGTPAGHGWGIPMATDIAFALGVLALLGSRIPPGLRIFLAALAIVDDLGAVIVIAFFYTEHISWVSLGIGLGSFALLMVMSRLHLRNIIPYVTVGLVLWIAFLLSGVHATIAGVLFALAVPARTRIDAAAFLDLARDDLSRFASAGRIGSGVHPNEEQQNALRSLESSAEGVLSPLQRFEYALEGWVAYGIVPLFALANAGVILAGGVGPPGTWSVFLGTAAGLFFGKPIGIMLTSWLAITFGAAAPSGVGWRHLFGAGILGGIGFTMAIFIANLAFTSEALLSAAKIGILVASPLAGVAGLAVLWAAREKD